MIYQRVPKSSDRNSESQRTQSQTRPTAKTKPSGVQPDQQQVVSPANRLQFNLLAGAQAKLTIGQPNDKYEQEALPSAHAEHVAAQVVNQLHAPTTQPSIQRETLEDEELQMKPEMQCQADKGAEVSSDLEAEIQQARGGGQSIAEPIRSSMEQAFGADFSGVRVHTDAQADQLSRSIQAKAFTIRQDVFFRQGEYNPGSRAGQELLAHELTHVVQQGQAGNRATLSSLNTLLLQRVVSNEQKVTQSDIGSFLRGYGTVLVATINGTYVGKFSATGGKHAEQNFYDWVTRNWKKLKKDGQIYDNQFNVMEVRITRSPCGESSANCGRTLMKLVNFFKGNGNKVGRVLDLRLLILSLYNNSSESKEVLENLYQNNVQIDAWDLIHELRGHSSIEYKHLNVASLRNLTPAQKLDVEQKRSQLGHCLHNVKKQSESLD